MKNNRGQLMLLVECLITLALAIILYIPVNAVIQVVLANMPANSIPQATSDAFNFGWGTWPIVLVLSLFVTMILAGQWKNTDSRRIY